MACMPKKNALGLDFFILCCNHIFCKSLFAKKYVFIFSTTTTTVTCMDVDWTEKARQHSAGRSAHDLSQKIATPSCGECRS